MSFPFAEKSVKEKTEKNIRDALEAATAVVASRGVQSIASKPSTYWVLATVIAAAGAAWTILHEPS